MQQQQDGQDHNDNNSEQPRTVSPVTGIAIAVWIYFFGAVGLWIVIRDNVPNPAESFGLFIESVLSFAIVIVVIVHAVMYYRQAITAAKQIELMVQNERAYIGVRRMMLVGLENNFSRIAVQVTFRNGGKSPAFGFRAYGEVSVGSEPSSFAWKEVTPDIKRAFIPTGEDRSVVIPYAGLVDTEAITGSNPTNRIFIDGEARYRTLDGKEIILCFGGTYLADGNAPQFEARHQYEKTAEENPN